ncbi:50S ribosomal protein L11 [Candidatus Pacearchaeota archaeon]|nr:50S ribosomal protein L11 [Candidatus Pacearchaeota archaeon]
MIIKLLIEGGDMKPGPAIAQKLGPLGINIGKVIQDVNKETQNFKGLKVPVELDVNPKSKSFEVRVSSPPVAELLKKEAGLEKGSGEAKKAKVGNLAIEQVIKIAKTKLPNMLCRNLKSSVKSVVGSCVSLGILVENIDPAQLEKEIVAGKYDKEINQEISEASAEKLKEMKDYFNKVKTQQEEIAKKEAEAKAAEEAAKAAAEAAKPAAAKTTEAAPAKPGEAKTAAPAATAPVKAAEKKPEAKKK